MKWKSWERLVKLEDEEADLSRWAGRLLGFINGSIEEPLAIISVLNINCGPIEVPNTDHQSSDLSLPFP
ncbi:hypothetical protein Bca101_020901 [Brassica carinata]